jgi:uncharacterized protein with von Willebrand factor type A (vWA) domain
MERTSHPILQERERVGAKRNSRFPDLQRDLFCDLKNPKTPEVDSPDSWGKAIMEQARVLGSYKGLKTQCRNNSYYSGLATKAVSKKLIQSLKPRKSNVDTKALQDKVDDLKDLLNRNQASGGEGNQRLSDKLEKLEDRLKKAKQEEDNLKKGLDPSAVRKAVDEASEEAAEEIREINAMVQSLSYGSEPGTPAFDGDPDGLRAMAEMIQSNPTLMKLWELAGKMRMTAKNKQRNKPNKQPTELHDIEVGSNLETILPEEAMLLVSGNENMELEFFSRYCNDQLLQYALRGSEDEDQGPIVCCIDVSGSTEGTISLWEKATALALIEIAIKQKRSFSVIMYDSAVRHTWTVRKGQKINAQEMSDTMAFFSGGGTSFEAPLREAVKVIEEDGEFTGADIVFLTDGSSNTSEDFRKWFTGKLDEHSINVYTVLFSAYASEVGEWSDEIYNYSEIINQGETDNDFSDKVFSI